LVAAPFRVRNKRRLKPAGAGKSLRLPLYCAPEADQPLAGRQEPLAENSKAVN